MTEPVLLKRLIDLLVGSALLVILSPLMAAIALGILITSGRPILFRQIRPGLHGVPFSMYKFRTMRPPRPDEDIYTTDQDRLSRLGRLLRRTSLDELPGLLNVVSGRMSLVGPRPLLMEYLPRYNPRHARRHAVRPGITGLAQVSGRRSLSLGQRLDLDVQYVDNWSLVLDLRILLRTLAQPFLPGDIVGQSLEEIDDVHLIHPVLERVD